MPPERHAALTRLVENNGINGSYLAYGWVVAAYNAVIDAEDEGVDPQLPSREPLAQRLPQVTWQQGQSQYERCREAFARHGSSVEAVVNAGAQRYVDGGGALAAHHWRVP